MSASTFCSAEDQVLFLCHNHCGDEDDDDDEDKIVIIVMMMIMILPWSMRLICKPYKFNGVSPCADENHESIQLPTVL